MGIIAVFLSTLFSTSKDILSKKLAVRIDGTASTFASFGFALPFYLIVLAFLWLMGHDIFTFSMAFWVLVLFRALTDVFAEGMKMYSFAHGDISLVTIIFSLSPLCVLALTPMFTDDQLSLQGTLAVILVVFGSVALVYRPSHPDWAKQKTAMLLAVGAAFFFGLNSILDKKAMNNDMQPPEVSADGSMLADTAFLVRPAVGGFAMTAVSAAFLLPFVCFSRERMVGMWDYRGPLLQRGFLEVAFMVCKLTAMVYLPAAYVVALHRASLLLSIIAGRFIFKEGDFNRRMAAGLLILAGVAWIVWEQGKQSP